MKGHVPDSVRFDILGHEGVNETMRTYDQEARLAVKLTALDHVTCFTQHLQPFPLCLRPIEQQKGNQMQCPSATAVKVSGTKVSRS